LIELEAGWPMRAAYRSGYFHRAAAHDEICLDLPQHGESSGAVVNESLGARIVIRSLFTDVAVGLVHALGVGGCPDESVLLGDLRALLQGERRAGGRCPAVLLDRLLDETTWAHDATLFSESLTTSPTRCSDS
jgi:siderophore synthetase component